MNAARVTLELKAIQRRTRRFLIASIVVHAVFLFYAAWEKVMSPADEELTEVVWVEEDEIESLLAQATTSYYAAQAEAPEPIRQHYEREKSQGDVAPAAQEIDVFEDKVSDRLTALQQQAARRSRSMATLETQQPTRRITLAGVPGATARPGELVRAQSPPPKPIALKRGKPRVQKAAVAVPLTPEPKPVSKPSRQTEVPARKVLAGISMSGPVADRPLVSYRKPAYPEWAKREAIEGSVDLYFVVQPDGTVKTNVMVQKTSGFEDFDRNAADALLAWRFEPLASGVTGEQWGTITFHYRLSTTGN